MTPPPDIDRRHFLRWSALGAAATGIGCGESPTGSFFRPFAALVPGAGGVAPFAPPDSAGIDPVTHALNRLTFGPRPGDHERVSRLAPGDPAAAVQAFIDEQLAPARIRDAEAEAAAASLETLWLQPIGEFLDRNEDQLLDEMIRATLLRATLSRRQLFEVMVSFWSDHFNIDPSKGDARWFKTADDRDVVRRHALGNFRDLLKASALSPAMLWYLDGRVNRKTGPHDLPNENYARELLELHTLGVDGGYGQRDVMEVARCLSGWTVRARDDHRIRVGGVEFDTRAHDDGPKFVLGHAIPAGLGAGDLDRVLDLLCDHPSTARHLATRLCRRFIADDPPADAVTTVAGAFRTSGGDIAPTLRALFATPAFADSRGAKFKRPFHFVVSCLRATAARTDAGHAVQDALQRMGHLPFHYPTPDGYPLEPEPWTASLVWRWRFALLLARGRLAGTTIDRDALTRAAGGPDGLARHLLGRRPEPAEETALAALDPEERTALLLAGPAFQTF